MGRPVGKRPLGRRWIRWEDIIRKDFLQGPAEKPEDF
jgi:hypothetical protein